MTRRRIALALAALLCGCASSEQGGPEQIGPAGGDQEPAPVQTPTDPPPPGVPEPQPPPGEPAGPLTSSDGHVWSYFPNLELYLDETERRYYWRQRIGWFDSTRPPRDLNPNGEEKVGVELGGRIGEPGPSDADLERHRQQHPKVH